MSQNTPDQNAAEVNLGITWEQNPQVWKNFVLDVIEQKYLQKGNHLRVLVEVMNELDEWNLTLEKNSVQGPTQDLTAWILAYA